MAAGANHVTPEARSLDSQVQKTTVDHPNSATSCED
jgi:hypothetical protein